MMINGTEPQQSREQAFAKKLHQPEGIQPSFRLTEHEVQFREEDEEGEARWVTVCSRLEIAAMTRNPNGEEWGRVLRFVDDDGHQHEWSMPMSMLAGDGAGYRERLLDQGLYVAPGKRARDRLHEYILTTKPPARARAVSAFGWRESSFVIHDEILEAEEAADE